MAGCYRRSWLVVETPGFLPLQVVLELQDWAERRRAETGGHFWKDRRRFGKQPPPR